MPAILHFPSALAAPGSGAAPWRPAVAVRELPPGAMVRVSFGDLDVLVAHTTDGIAAVDDRCPHQSAPLSIGDLDGCVVACPLHSGRFDLATGEAVQWPTTGGLMPDGTAVPAWTPPGREEKVDLPGRKSDARRLTRIRRLRYYRLRITATGMIEIAVPV